MIIESDCIKAMKYFPENYFDAIVCDPPYGLEFMGKEWDKLRNTWQAEKGRYHNDTTFLARGDRIRYKAGLEMQIWHTQWLTEAYRVLKPGGSMLVMGGTRTSHRLACAIEDSGFIIKDTLMWLYGSGFPKAQDLGKMIDKRAKAEREIIGKERNWGKASDSLGIGDKEWNITLPYSDLAKHWDGFKVGGIKPAYEPIIWAVKPPEGSYVDNVLKWGVGAVNVDECRVGLDNNDHKGKGGGGVHEHWVGKDMKNRIYGQIKRTDVDHSKGRFPANVILSHHPECVQVGVKRVKTNIGWTEKDRKRKASTIFNDDNRNRSSENNIMTYADKDGYEQVESWDCHPDCAVRLLDEQSGVLKSGNHKVNLEKGKCNIRMLANKVNTFENVGDSGGASRFFYCAKTSRGERNAGTEDLFWLEGKQIERELYNKLEAENEINKNNNSFVLHKIQKGNTHPTVKPIRLFEYLIKLVTREGQVILDPFLGSGTTMIAANNVNRICVGIEREKEYCKIVKKRIKNWKKK